MLPRERRNLFSFQGAPGDSEFIYRDSPAVLASVGNKGKEEKDRERKKDNNLNLYEWLGVRGHVYIETSYRKGEVQIIRLPWNVTTASEANCEGMRWFREAPPWFLHEPN